MKELEQTESLSQTDSTVFSEREDNCNVSDKKKSLIDSITPSKHEEKIVKPKN